MAAFENSKDSRIIELENRVNKLEGVIERLGRELKALSNKFESAKIPMEVIDSTRPTTAGKPLPLQPTQRPVPVSAITVPTPPEPEKTVHNFYLSTPNSDGSFNNSSANSTYKEGASIYKFQNSQANRAKFKIDEHDASVKLALAYPDKNIDPVCDAQNAFDPRARRIFTVEPGIAELSSDNKWKVITKAKIRYES